jgi:two-component system, OmpR family, response regulator ResD
VSTAAPVPPRVLLIDDDPNLVDVLSRYLSREGLSVETERDGRAGLARALETLPDLVVLDVMLPSLDGMEVCRRLRSVAPIPVIMLTARGGEDDRVLGLELGADDYVAKPFSPRELTARVKAVLRRAATTRTLVGTQHRWSRSDLGGTDDRPHSTGELTERESMAVLVAGDLEVDIVAHEARRRGVALALTTKEFELLAHFVRHPRRAFRREELLAAVWGWTYGDTATVTVHVRRIREKIEDDPSNPLHLATVWGVGYRWDP